MGEVVRNDSSFSLDEGTSAYKKTAARNGGPRRDSLVL